LHNYVDVYISLDRGEVSGSTPPLTKTNKKKNYERRIILNGDKFIFTLTIILDISFGWQDKKNLSVHVVISNYLVQAVSIFIDMDESGARSNEWIYK